MEPLVVEIPVSEIHPSPYQHRRHFGTESLAELAKSIEREGLIEPVVVRRNASGFELIAGERRVRAVRLTTAETILARIVEASDLQARRMCAAENLQREDLSAVEQVEALVEMIDAELIEDEDYASFGTDAKHRVSRLLGRLHGAATNAGGHAATQETERLTNKFISKVEAVFSALPRSVSWQSFYVNDMKLLSLPEEVREVAIANKLNKSQAKALNEVKKANPKAYQDLLEVQSSEGVAVIDTVGLFGFKDTDAVELSDLSAREIKSLAAPRESFFPRHAPEKPTPPLPPGKFSLIYADPPWPYDFSRDSADAIEVRYRTMTVSDIRDLMVDGRSVRDLSHDQCVLFLWATSAKLPEALRIMRAWGFRYRSSWIWHKSGLGMGYWARVDHEFLLIGVKGDHPCPESDVRESSVIAAPKAEHSRKPEAFRQRIERTFPEATRVELFGRGKAPKGWTFWGNEAERDSDG